MTDTGSHLANMQARREQLLKVRAGLLDRPGLPPRSKSTPPPAVPAANKKSPQQKSLSKSTSTPTAAPSDQPTEGIPPDEQAQTPIVEVDPETRRDMLEQAELFLQHVRRVKRARLHRTLGRARKFMGGGL